MPAEVSSIASSFTKVLPALKGAKKPDEGIYLEDLKEVFETSAPRESSLEVPKAPFANDRLHHVIPAVYFCAGDVQE